MLVTAVNISTITIGPADPKNRIKVHAQALGQDGRARLVYTVKSGDVPGAIAMKFNVRLAEPEILEQPQ